MPQYTRILNLGDSITYGARARWGQTYPVQLEALLDGWVPSICINAGVNGERSYEIVERAWSHLGSDDWIKICVTMMGTNDSKPGGRTPHQLYLEQWERLERMCRCTDVKLIALEIPRINPYLQPEYDAESMPWIAAANELLEAWCETKGVPYIGGFYAGMTDPLLADGIHPNNGGNRLIATKVAEYFGTAESRPSAPADDIYAGRDFVHGGIVPSNGKVAPAGEYRPL